MATNFPAAIDTTATLPNPGGADALNNAAPALVHAYQHDTVNDALRAIETKLGVDGSTDVTSVDYKLAHVAPASGGSVAGNYQPIVKPVAANWTPFNQETASIITTSSALCIVSAPGNGDHLNGLSTPVPTAPYRARFAVTFNLKYLVYNSIGVGWRDSVSGKIVNLNLVFDANQNGSDIILWPIHWNGAVNGFAGYYPAAAQTPLLKVRPHGPLWIELADDGTNRYINLSADGFLYANLLTTASSEFLVPDQLCFYACGSATANIVSVTLCSYQTGAYSATNAALINAASS